MRFTGTVMKTSLAGALVDIGVEIPGVVHISQLQEAPVNRVEDVVQVGQEVEVWVKRVIPKKKRLELTMLEPLNLEWREIKQDMVLKGKVVRLEKFGAFIDIGAERPGLVHISEITHDYIGKPDDVIKEGEEVEVMVLNVNRQKKQIKLSMKTLEIPPAVEDYERPSRPSKKKVEQEDKPVEPDPTAMEIALRDAMDRTKDDDKSDPVSSKKQKPSAEDNELDDILTRTLHNRVQSTN
jgi:ribosomal protein S1